MCLNEKLSHIVKVKSRNTELYVFKKNDFLKLSFNYKEFIEKFLQKSLMLYLKFNDEKKKAIKEYEVKHKILSVDSVKPEESLEKISEEEEDGSEEYNVYDDHPIYSQRGGSKDEGRIEEESKSDFSEKSSQRSGFQNTTRQNKDHDPNQNKNNILNSGIINLNPLPATNKPSKSYTNQHHQRHSFSSNTNTPSPSFHLLNPNPNSTKLTVQPTSSNINLIEDHSFRDMKSSMAPIMEINNHVEKVKNDIHESFCIKIEKIIQFFEEYNIKFEEKSEENNPLYLLKKLTTIKELNERNDIIDRIEMIISHL